MDNGNFKHFIDGTNLSRAQYLEVFDCALDKLYYVLKGERVPDPFGLEDSQVAPGFITVLFEPSTGTRISFDAAAEAMGCRYPTSAIADPKTTSSKKGEPVYHTVRRLYLQADVNYFAIRSGIAGLTKALAYHFDQEHSGHTMLGNDITFLNAGEATSFHLSQVLLDALGIIVIRDKTFLKAIINDGKTSVGHPHFVKALARFRRSRPENRKKRIAKALDGTRICFAGDAKHSRIVFNWRVLGERDETGQKKFDITYVQVAPEVAQLADQYLINIEDYTQKEMSPDLEVDIFYRIRWQFERGDELFKQIIEEVDAEFRINRAFTAALSQREQPAWVFDALPIDAVHRSIEQEVEDHPNVMCWLQAKMAKPLRMALIKLSYQCWKDDASAKRYRWKVPNSIVPEFIDVRQPIRLSDYIERCKNEGLREEDEVDIKGKPGCNLDHLPVDIIPLLMIYLRRLGFEGRIITSDRVTPRDDQKKSQITKDMMWFPGSFLHVWNPQIIPVLYFLAKGQLTYNVFDPAEDIFSKWQVEHSGRIIRILRCPAGIKDCIDGHRDQVPVTSIFNFFTHFDQVEQKKIMFAECEYCKGIFTSEQMLMRLEQTLNEARNEEIQKVLSIL